MQDLIFMDFPVFQKIDQQLWMGLIQGDRIDKAEPMDDPLLIGHFSPRHLA